MTKPAATLAEEIEKEAERLECYRCDITAGMRILIARPEIQAAVRALSDLRTEYDNYSPTACRLDAEIAALDKLINEVENLKL